MNTQTQEALNGLKHLEHVSAQLKTYSDQGQHKHIPSYLSAGHCYEIAKEMDSVIKACKEALAQPSWQGLSDDEIEAVTGEDIRSMYSGTYNSYRAIEAKLKEKNT